MMMSAGLDDSRREFLRQLTSGVGLCASGLLDADLAIGRSLTAAAYPAQKTYTNPVYTGSMPDPMVLPRGFAAGGSPMLPPVLS